MALDYYDILGVPPKADAGEIRKAYRLLALKWHPDRNPSDPWATSRFLRLGEAYRVLSDPARRAAYDWLRFQERQGGEGEAHFSSRRRHGQDAGVTPLGSPARRPLRSASSRRQPAKGRNRSQKRERQSRASFPRQENLQGLSGGFSSWLLSLKNLPHLLKYWLTGNPPADLEWNMVSTANQPDLIMELRLPRWLAAQGGKVNFLVKNHHQQRRLKLAIPPGVKEGSCLRIKGGGKTAGLTRGHLYINIRLKD